MLVHSAAMGKRLLANIALEGPLARVDPHVAGELAGPVERLAAALVLALVPLPLPVCHRSSASYLSQELGLGSRVLSCGSVSPPLQKCALSRCSTIAYQGVPSD